MTTQEDIAKLWQYEKYCRTKKKHRNNETLEAIKDCIKILEDRFSEIRSRDKQYEERNK